jgi:ATP-dependent helicase/nuclease subunit A
MPPTLRDDELRFPHVERLTASAGSGKTHALARRYVQFLLSDRVPFNALPQILAVTFTNKAAKEMRDRILEWLKASAFQDEGRKEVREEVRRSLANQASLAPRCKAVLDRIFDQWPDFSVRTIDSFLLALAQGSAYELALPPRGKPVLDHAPLLKEAIDLLLDRSGSDPALAAEVERAVDELAATRPEMGWQVGRTLASEQEVLERLVSATGQEVLDCPDALGDFFRLREAARGHAARLVEGLKACGAEFRGATYIEKLERFARTGDLKEAGGSTMIREERLSAALKKGVGATDDLEKEWERLRGALSGAAFAWAQAQAQPHLRLRAQVLPLLDELCRRDGALLLSRLPARFAAFLESHGVPAAYFTWGERVRHFLLDEFQDTSDTQWAAFFPLVEEALSQGGSLFYVGDRKQAIYRFRGGRAELFDLAREDLGAFAFRDGALDTNYRSREALVAYFNRTFSRENLERWAAGEALPWTPEEFEAQIWPLFESAEQSPSKSGGYVRVERRAFPKGVSYDEALAEVADRAAAELLPDLLSRGFRYGDMAVLLRDNRHAAIVSQRLLDAGVPVASPATLALPSSQPAQEVVALLRWLDSPVDDLAFASFVLGRLFGEAAGLSKEALFGFLNRRAGLASPPLYGAFREQFTEAWERLLEPLFTGVGYLPPYDLVHQAVELLGVLDRSPGDEMAIYHLLELLRQREGEGENALGQFLRFWDENPDDPSLEVPLSESGDAVRVLTVHKAKGLGFPVVLLPLPYLSGRSESCASVREARGILRLRFTKSEEALCPELEEIRRQEKVAGLRDELNAFYVALTRAAVELHVVLGEFEDKRSLSYKRPPPLLEETQEGLPERAVAAPGRPVYAAPVRHPSAADWRSRMLPRRREGYQPPVLAAGEAERRGTLVHLALSLGMAGNPGEAERLVALGAAETLSREVVDLLRARSEHPLLGPLLRPAPECRVENELTLLDAKGRIFRVDRLIASGTLLTVVDWKTGREDLEGHGEQVRNYCRLLSEIRPGAQVRGVLAYLDEGRVVEVPW